MDSRALQVWDQHVACFHKEHALRDPSGTPTSPLVLEYLEASKKLFLGQWSHVTAVARGGSSRYRTDYFTEILEYEDRGKRKDSLKRVMEALMMDVVALVTVLGTGGGEADMQEALSAVEGVLVACLGYVSQSMRALSVRLLNVVYDRTTWQLTSPLPPTIAYVGGPFTIDVCTPLMTPAQISRLVVLVAAPPVERSLSPTEGTSTVVVTAHTPRVVTERAWVASAAWEPWCKGTLGVQGGGGFESVSSNASSNSGGAFPQGSTDRKPAYLDSPSNPTSTLPAVAHFATVTRITLSLTPFSRCGFYDWRVVVLDPSTIAAGGGGGSPPTTTTTTPPSPHSQSEPSGAGVGAANFLPYAQGMDCIKTLKALKSHEVLAAVVGGALPPSALPKGYAEGSGEGVGSMSSGGGGGGGVEEAFAAPTLPPTTLFGLAQGRFIVHREGLRKERWHTSMVDTEAGLRVDGGEGKVSRHGTFLDVQAGLKGLKERESVTSLYLCGAMERDNGWGEGSGVSDILSTSAPGSHSDAAAAAASAGAGGSSSSNQGGVFDAYSVHQGGWGRGGMGGGEEGGNAAAPPQDDGGSTEMELAATEDVLENHTGESCMASRPNANPFSVVDRVHPNRMLGGPTAFSRLISSAKEVGISVVVQLDPFVSASRPHRKYTSLYARILDATGRAAVHAGCDSLENQWEDTHLLNYRLVETWECLVEEAVTLVQRYGLGGLYLTEAQSYPFIQRTDEIELGRKDVDGERHYSPREVLEGKVVMSNREVGFWVARGTSATYPNPLLVKMARALWRVAPNTVLVGECHWGRAGALSRSGLLPHTFDLAVGIAAMGGKALEKLGTDTPCDVPKSIRPIALLRACIESESSATLPPQLFPLFKKYLTSGRPYPDPGRAENLTPSPGGALAAGGQDLILRSLASPHLPYPASYMGRGTWTAVDLMFSLPGLPGTFGGETVGLSARVDIVGSYNYNEAYLKDEEAKAAKRAAAVEFRTKMHTAMVARNANSHSGSSSTGAVNLMRGGGGGGGGGAGQHGKTLSPPSTSANSVAGGLPRRLSELSITSVSASQVEYGQMSSSSSSASLAPPPTLPPFMSESGEQYAGHIGVGGVVGPFGPSFGEQFKGLRRSGFSHFNLASLSAVAGGIAMGGEGLPLSGGGSGSGIPPLPPTSSHSATAALPPSTLSNLPPGFKPFQFPGTLPSVLSTGSNSNSNNNSSAWGGGGGVPPPPPSSSSSSLHPPRYPSSSMRSVPSSPALQMLLGHASNGSGSGSGNNISGSSALSTPHPSTSTINATAHTQGGGMTITSSHTSQTSLWGLEASLHPTHTSVYLPSSSQEDMSVHLSVRERDELGQGVGGRGAWDGEDEDQTPYDPPLSPGGGGSDRNGNGNGGGGGGVLHRGGLEVRSWVRAREGVCVSGLPRGSQYSITDALRSLPDLEAIKRREIRPDLGFDLTKIGGHYAHRAAVRNRYPALREGGMVPLTARHRFGEHENVLAFARTLVGEQVAVIACNFNDYSSVLSVDNAPLAAAFSATNVADASGAVVGLMNASLGVGAMISDLLTKGEGGVGGPSSTPFSSPSSSSSLYAPLNLRGGVWEARDVFRSGPSVASLGEMERVSPLSDSDGPLVAIMASDEAAFAPITSTLSGHQSSCWLFSRATPRDINTSMQWLFASSLLRLQSNLRLKEVGLTSAVVTKGEVGAAGGYDAFLRASSSRLGEKEWIQPYDILKDELVQSVVRHNLVYSLLRDVVKRAMGLLTASLQRTVPATSGGGGDGGDGGTSSSNAILTQTSNALAAALRVLTVHWRLRQAPTDMEGVSLRCEPLPPLSAASSSTSASSGDDNSGAGESSWYCINGEVAAVVTRAALFLAIKNVVARVMGSEKYKADVSTGVYPEGLSEGEWFTRLSSLLLRALASIARGEGSGALKLSSSSPSPSPTPPTSLPSDLIPVELGVIALARGLCKCNALGPIVFVTPEVEPWSTVGGLGVMVAELATGLAELGAEVLCISPYYNHNRKGLVNYLAKDGILYTGRNVSVRVGGERCELGVHEGVRGGVHYFFLHNATVFPKPYPPHDAAAQMRVMTAFCKGTLELLCQWRVTPSLIITNDWFTALVPAFTRNKKFFGSYFNATDFCHICHNLDEKYEGRLYPGREQGYLGHLHDLDKNLLVDPYWGMQGGQQVIVNPSRAALMTSDTWATVSQSYKAELLAGSPLKALLQLPPHPFAQSNGISVKDRTERLRKAPACGALDHWEAKGYLQEKFFKRRDPSLILFAFVGRITEQKGVLLILECVERILYETNFQAQILVGGGADPSDGYGKACMQLMYHLKAKFGENFWADPEAFFTDGPVVNLGADFCLMPSAFEPGGIVQQEFFLGGTPVIAYRTGGLKDTVVDWDPIARTGNGFTFGAHHSGELYGAMKRAVAVYSDRDAYGTLRVNARGSCLDLKDVTRSWYNEFHRIRRCIPPPPADLPAFPPSIPTHFKLLAADVPELHHASTVFLAGTFTEWKPTIPLHRCHHSNDFEATARIPCGAHTYKFLVDGVWKFSPSAHRAEDEGRNVNNVIVVVPSPVSLIDLE